MARLNLTAPCDSCAASTEALSILGTSLHTAVEAAKYIRIPLPQIPPPLSHVASEHIPQELKEVCARHGYYIAEGVNSDTTFPAGPPIAAKPDQAESMSVKVDTLSATDDSDVKTDISVDSDTEIKPDLEDAAGTSATASTDTDRWYAVTVGRNPGVFRGSVTTNVIGIPGGFCRRYGTRELAIAAYNAALDGGEVTEVTVSKRVLSRNT